MMLDHARRSFNAACLLAVRDPRAWKEFDLTADGFFRSFIAILFVIPLNVLFDLFAIRLTQARSAGEGATSLSDAYGTPELVFSTVTLAIEWMLFPIVALYLLRYLGLQQRYAQYIIAHNWGRIVTELLNLPAIVLFSAGLISDQAATDCLFITLGLTLYYRFYIAQTALDVGWSLAMALSILQLLLTILFAVAVRNGAGLWLPA